MAVQTTRQTVLFDLGGVLADLGDPVTDMGLRMTREEFWRIWLSSEHVRSFETGRLSEVEFVPRIARELQTSDPHTFDSRFRKWRLSLFPGIEELIEHVAGFANLALLSNTNPTHWNQLNAQSNVFERFDELFLSFETGFFKPDKNAFVDVISTLHCEPSQILFVDDSETNVSAAKEIGIDARLVRGARSMRCELGI